MIYYQENLFSPVTQCPQEKFIEVMKSERVKTTCATIAQHVKCINALMPETEATAGEIKRLKNGIQKEKKRLPAFIFQGAFPGGRRRQEECRLTGLYMTDFDHIGDPRLWIEDRLAGTQVGASLTARLNKGEISRAVYFNSLATAFFSRLHESRGVVLAHVTPSGEGLRIVAKADTRTGNLADNQAQLARVLGLKNDEAVKDASRISFAFPEENLLYLNNELFNYENNEYDKEFGDGYRRGISNSVNGNGCHGGISSHMADGNSQTARQPAVQTAGDVQRHDDDGRAGGDRLSDDTAQRHDKGASGDEEKSALTYRGAAYKDIIAEWWRQNGGEPKEGERNLKLFNAAAAIRYITENNADRLLAVMPAFGLDLQEMRQICESACRRQFYTVMPKRLLSVLRSVGIDMQQQKQTYDDEVENGETAQGYLDRFRKLDLPPVLKAVTSGVPRQVRIGAVLASLPMFYTLLSRIRFRHFDGSDSRLSGMTFVVGPAASGKSFILDLDRLLMSPIRMADAAGRALEQQYRESKEMNKNKKEQQQRPHPCIRILPIQISNTMLATRMRDAVDSAHQDTKLHCYSVEAELATAIRAQKGGSWIEKNDIYCKAFHNEYWGMDYANDQAINGEIQVNYNLVISGTEDSFDRLIPTSTVLSGLPTRLMYFPMPDQRFQMLDKAKNRRSPKEQTLLQETAQHLYELDLHDFDAQTLSDAMYDWCARMAKRAEMEDDAELDDLRKRTALIGLRAGVAYTIIDRLDDIRQGKPFAPDRRATDFALFVADYCLHTQYMKFAARMREQKQRVADYAGRREQPMKLVAIYNRLPSKFCLDDLAALRPGTNRNSLIQNCFVWQKKALIRKDTVPGRFIKIVEQV